KILDDQRFGRDASGARDAQRARNRFGDDVWIRDRTKSYEPRPIGETRQHFRRDLLGEPRLANPSYSGERDQTGAQDHLGQLSDLAFATHEARELDRKVRVDLERSEPRKLRRKCRVHQLVHAHRLREVAQSMLTEVEE